MTSIRLDVPGAPVAKGRPRFSRQGGRAFTPAKTVQAESTLAARVYTLVREHWTATAWPSREAMIVDVTFVLPVPQSWPAWKRAAALESLIRPTCRPDVDNLVKLTKDALNGILWLDDSQIVGLTATKVYGDTPSTVIEAREITQQKHAPAKAAKGRRDRVA
jgi:Holliday junction resolvase RusA-like endonuclease